MTNNGPSLRVDIGLLVLRLAAGLSMIFLFGLGKLLGLIHIIELGKPLATSGLGPLIHKMGFPAAGLLAAFAVLAESLFPLLVAAGFMTRLAALASALSMAGAFYTSLRLVEEPLRAILYLVMFAALVLTGPGRYSIDSLLKSMGGGKAQRKAYTN